MQTNYQQVMNHEQRKLMKLQPFYLMCREKSYQINCTKKLLPIYQIIVKDSNKINIFWIDKFRKFDSTLIECFSLSKIEIWIQNKNTYKFHKKALKLVKIESSGSNQKMIYLFIWLFSKITIIWLNYISKNLTWMCSREGTHKFQLTNYHFRHERKLSFVFDWLFLSGSLVASSFAICFQSTINRQFYWLVRAFSF